MTEATGLPVPQWRAVVTYRTRGGSVDVTHELEHLFELHTLIDRGPDLRSLRDIRICLVRESDPSVALAELVGSRDR